MARPFTRTLLDRIRICFLELCHPNKCSRTEGIGVRREELQGIPLFLTHIHTRALNPRNGLGGVPANRLF